MAGAVRSDHGAMVGIPGNSGWLSSLRSLGVHQQTQATAIERLSTGKRINRASDDPSGMVAAGNFKVRQVEITKKLEAFELETARLGAREGGLSVVQDMLLELQGLVIQGANTGGLGEGELDSIITQAQGIVEGINYVTQTTIFKGEQILIGSTADRLGSVTVDGEQRGLGSLGALLKDDPEAAQKLVDGAVDSVSGGRAAIGIRMNQIESEMRVMQEEFEGNATVLSLIEDADFAKETAELVRSQILEQATIKGILIERENAERVLDLIAGPVQIQARV